MLPIVLSLLCHTHQFFYGTNYYHFEFFQDTSKSLLGWAGCSRHNNMAAAGHWRLVIVGLVVVGLVACGLVLSATLYSSLGVEREDECSGEKVNNAQII